MEAKEQKQQPIRKRIFRWAKRIFKTLALMILAYLIILLVGMIPVNNDFEPSPEGIKLYIVSHAVHADIILPIESNTIDWSDEFNGYEFGSGTANKTHVAIGWGDKGFFLKTKTWDDFKISVAANALLVPSTTCVHVSFTRPEFFENRVSVTISESQYEELVKHINQSFVRNENGKPIQIPDSAYSDNDAFFDAKGRYHLFNTCNSWVGNALKKGGVFMG